MERSGDAAHWVLDTMPLLRLSGYFTPGAVSLRLYWRRRLVECLSQGADDPRSTGDHVRALAALRGRGELSRGSSRLTFYWLESNAANVVSSLLYEAVRPPSAALVRPPDAGSVEAQMQTPPPQAARVASAFVARYVVMAALQPYSVWSLYHLLVPPEEAQALYEQTREVHSRWVGWQARALSGAVHHVVFEFGVLPVVVRASRPLRRPATYRRAWSRPGVWHRLRVEFTNTITRTVATLTTGVLCYPLECVRYRMETQVLLRAPAQLYRGWLHCVRSVWATEGLRGFYRGMGSWALAAPLEMAWPFVAWSTAAVAVRLIFDDDDGDDKI